MCITFIENVGEFVIDEQINLILLKIIEGKYIILLNISNNGKI